MDIILKKDVENLGSKNDTVSVRAGYANNFLIPNGLATIATASARKIAAENIRQCAHKEAKFRADATAIADQLAKITLESPLYPLLMNPLLLKPEKSSSP